MVRASKFNSFPEILGRIDIINDELINSLRDKDFEPTKEDFRILELISQRFHEGFALTNYIDRKLTERIEKTD